jgi:glucose/arabinose dehydrogenase
MKILCRWRDLAVLATLLLGAAAQAIELRPVTVAEGLERPWALAFLPDGRMLVTEREGRMRIVDGRGRVSAPLAGLPAISVGNQCGLLDVVVDPRFADNQRIFFSFAEPAADGGGNGTAVASARLVGDALVDVRTIFSQSPKLRSQHHCGSRIVIARDGRLWVGLGDRFSAKEEAQNPANHIGKIVRIEADGRVPADNPFVGRAGVAQELWSLGHRNIQGAAMHPVTGHVWATEHGPQGGDELNVVAPGANHGWPRVTKGRNYGLGTRIGEEGPVPGFEEPLRTWGPTSVAPSGLAFLTSDRYPGWQGSLFMGTLRGQALLRLALDGNRVAAEERLLGELGERIRDVRQGPDGWLYALTDSRNGRILRLER